jgi:hypothetical protein
MARTGDKGKRQNMPNRRAFLAATAAAPIAAVAGTLPVAAATTIEPPVARLLPSPYKEHPWRWFVSQDKEIYHEDFDTLAEALECARTCDYSFVAEAQQQNYALDVDGDEILELLYGHNEEHVGEGEFLTPNRDQTSDLGKMVTAAIEAWAVKHQIDVTAWSFAETRNHTEVP